MTINTVIQSALDLIEAHAHKDSKVYQDLKKAQLTLARRDFPAQVPPGDRHAINVRTR
jgi:hypothetical protein